jgi:hypothetical protein
MENAQVINSSVDMNRDRVKVDITDADKERYFKSVLTDTPYEEIVELFGGQLKLKFRMLTVQENTDVVNQIIDDKKNGVASENDAYFITIASYRLALCLQSIDDKPFSTIAKANFTSADLTDTYIKARQRPMLSWGTAKLSAFLDAFQTFEGKLIKLTNEVQSVNFWKASV